MDHRLVTLMLAQGGVFTLAQAMEHGMTRDDVRSRVRRNHLMRVRHNVYTTTAVLEAADSAGRHRIAIAAALVNRGWVAGDAAHSHLVGGHRSAGVLWRLPVRPHAADGVSAAGSAGPTANAQAVGWPSYVELVSADRARRTYRAGVGVRPAALPPEHITAVDGVPVTTLARTAVDLMRESARQDAVMIGDAALRLGCDRDELRAVADYCARWRGGKQAVEAAQFADGRAESAAESLARLVFGDHGLPPAELQLQIRDSAGRTRRIDIGFRTERTGVEIDGKVKYTDPHGPPGEVLWKEKQREDSIREMGWEVVRATWAQLTTDPAEVVARVRAAFVRGRRLAG